MLSGTLWCEKEDEEEDEEWIVSNTDIDTGM